MRGYSELKGMFTVAVCCSVLQYVAVCCSVLHHNPATQGTE